MRQTTREKFETELAAAVNTAHEEALTINDRVDKALANSRNAQHLADEFIGKTDTEKQIGEDGEELVMLFNAIERISHGRQPTQYEWDILCKHDCVYIGDDLKERLENELEWFKEKREILQWCAGFWNFLKRSKLYGQPIIDWFKEYDRLFPDGQCCYLGYDYEQTVGQVDSEIARLRSGLANGKTMLKYRAREIRAELISALDIAKKQRRGKFKSSDRYPTLPTQSSLFESATIMAFIVASLGSPSIDGTGDNRSDWDSGINGDSDSSSDGGDSGGDSGGGGGGGGGGDSGGDSGGGGGGGE